jgi:hypothetical protein
VLAGGDGPSFDSQCCAVETYVLDRLASADLALSISSTAAWPATVSPNSSLALEGSRRDSPHAAWPSHPPPSYRLHMVGSAARTRDGRDHCGLQRLSATTADYARATATCPLAHQNRANMAALGADVLVDRLTWTAGNRRGFPRR